ncbi:hydrolase [Bacillus sp. 7504-2]|nr:hydrolase [Bacillus sp. 7504-2]
MKCFSIDLDGTLLNSKREISTENLHVLKELKAQGHSVIINTGRAYDDVIQFNAIKSLNLPIFTINGTVIYSDTKDVLFEASIPFSLYNELFAVLKKFGLWIMVYTNQGGFPCRNPYLQGKNDQEIEAIFADYDYGQLLNKKDLVIYKIMAVSRHDQLEKITAVKNALHEKLPLTIASSHPNNVELTSLEANKGAALLRYQKLINVHFDEIFAFGDGGNDVEQFKVATTSVAMANAPAEIQEHADIITKSNDDNGFAYAVKHLIEF